MEPICPRRLARMMLGRPDLLLKTAVEVQRNSKKGELVLDPFCGSGVLAAVASRLGRRVVAIDVSPDMAKFASGLLRRHGGGQARVGDAKNIKLPTASVDLILTSIPAWNTLKYSSVGIENEPRSLYWLGLRQAFGEMRRVLKPRRMCILMQSPEQARRLVTLASDAELPVGFLLVPGAR